ncbi:odontogenic ameloblast-associated protein [Choloepus didactylus]|uniref:odontogenic ameloblast-associated protein n=1 Tax=Choloepus didactylus TaxID=27675 RepID=UPI00189EE0F9|nr:odontogenic ameloblast-associated protein [Choloepus didactylus]
MEMIILLGILGATLSAPLIPQRLVSASNSNELRLNLNNAGFLPLQLQGPFSTLIPPFSGIMQQQQAPVPGLSQFSLSTLGQFVGLFPNKIPFPAQVSFSQGAQMNQLNPSQPQTPRQSQQGPDHVLPYMLPLKLPQEQQEMLQYYPIYMFLPWEQPQQGVLQSPQQTGQQQFEEQIPFYIQFGYILQQAEPVILGGQQQLAFDPFIGTAPENLQVPALVIPYLQKEMINSRHASAGIILPSTSPKPSTIDDFTSAIDPTITPELMEKKAKTDSLRGP